MSNINCLAVSRACVCMLLVTSLSRLSLCGQRASSYVCHVPDVCTVYSLHSWCELHFSLGRLILMKGCTVCVVCSLNARPLNDTQVNNQMYTTHLCQCYVILGAPKNYTFFSMPCRCNCSR